MKSFCPLSFLVLALAGLLTGCSSGGVSALESISASVVDLRAESTTVGSRGTMSVRYLNQSILPIGVSETEHRLFVNGVLAGRAVNEEALGLPSSASSVKEISFEWEAPPPPAGSVTYRLETTLTVLAGSQELRSHSEQTGVVELKLVSGNR